MTIGKLKDSKIYFSSKLSGIIMSCLMLMVTLSVITRNAIMLNVITQNAIMLNFTAQKQLPPSPKQQYKMCLFFSKHVDPSRVVHEAEVEHGRVVEVLRAARLHLRAA
jgi:hypothetical protein